MACCTNSSQIVDKMLRKYFYWLGFNIGQRPGYFIIVPILLTALLSTGFQQMDYNYDPEYLFSPSQGEAKQERTITEHYFPTNFSDFSAKRITRPGKFGRVIIAAKDGGSMLRTELWNQVLYLDQVIYNVTVEHEGQKLDYTMLCALWNNQCFENEILHLSQFMPEIESQEMKVVYPVTYDPLSFYPYFLDLFFGGIQLNSDEVTVHSVEAIGLSYFLDVSEDWRGTVGDMWEKQFLDDVKHFGPLYYPDLVVGMFVSNTPAWEMEQSRYGVTMILIANVGAMVVFSFLAPFRADAAKSKPLVGFSGLFSACLATLAGFGFCCYIGVEWISLNLAAPFLLFGIGFDDTFVVLSAWSRSQSHLSVSERMGKTFADAGVSITFTSLTNICSCLAGAMTPFPSIRIFCIYTGVAMAFTYIWHLTMFGGFLALAGRAEAGNRHGALPCLKVTPKSLSQNRSWMYRTFMTGGINPNDPLNPLDNKEHVGFAFFRDQLGNWLNIGLVKTAIIVVYLVYLSGGIWGITVIKEGLEKRNTANFDSYSREYYNMDDMYFKKYAFSISVVISGPHIDFSNVKTQEQIETITKALESSKYIDQNLTESWLRDFLDYIKRNEGYSDVQLPVKTEEDFAQTLRDMYLSDPINSARLDVSFSQDNSRVEAARFLIQGHNINDSMTEQLMVSELREICAQYSTEDIQVSVFQPFFIYIDQYLAIMPQTLQTVFVTTAVMVLISLLLFQNLPCALVVFFSIVSIEIGVVGYMTWWGVRLDGVALINLIMCIGFSVDFSAHICYHYLTAVSEDEDPMVTGRPANRIKNSLYALGIPIVQGASSTIIGVSGLYFAHCYLYVTFFKMIFLVIVLGMFHGMILLPILLSLMGPGSCTKESNNTRSSGLSTPSLNAIACHKKDNQESCYTINLGYVSHSSHHHQGIADHEPPAQFAPYQYHQDYLQQHPSLQVHHELSSTDQSSPATSTSSSNVNVRRGANQGGGHGGPPGQRHQRHQKRNHHHKHHHHHHHHQVHVHPVNGRQMVATALEVSGFSTSTPDHSSKKLVVLTSESSTSAKLSEQNRQLDLDLRLAAISRIQQRSNQRSTCNAHRKVGRSRSHRPRVNESANAVSTLPDGMTGMQVNNNSVGIISDHRGYTTHETSSNPQNFSDKPVLRKHHSFPYEMFNNETSYSSDDSMKQY